MRDGRSLSKLTQGSPRLIMGEAWTPAPFGGRIGDPPANRWWCWRCRAGGSGRAPGGGASANWLEAVAAQGVLAEYRLVLAAARCAYACGCASGPRHSWLSSPPYGARLAQRRWTMAPLRCLLCADLPGLTCLSTPMSLWPYARLWPSTVASITHVRSGRAAGRGDRRGDRDRIYGRILPVEIYHLEGGGSAELAPDRRMAIAAIEQARAGGVDVAADMYPYAASGTGLSAILPLPTPTGGSTRTSPTRPCAQRSAPRC